MSSWFILHSSHKEKLLNICEIIFLKKHKMIVEKKLMIILEQSISQYFPESFVRTQYILRPDAV